MSYEDMFIVNEANMDTEEIPYADRFPIEDPDPEELNWFVTRDGSTISPGMATENDAWVWLQKHQPMSNDWAMKYEGYAIKHYSGR